MQETQVSFGAWVARLRRSQDLTQSELANRVGCSVSALRKIEGDERRPSRAVAELLAEALSVPADQRPLFLKVARRELAVDRLGAPPSVVRVLPPAGELSLLLPAPSLLPSASTPLVGRETELASIAQLLADPACRLVTLVGPGGIGKTRLALQLAANLQEHFSHGVYYVGLTSLTDPALLAQTIASAVACPVHGAAEPRVELVQWLRQRQLLIVMDNLEHLLDGVDLLAEILQHVPGVRLVTTSRERLNLQGEWLFEVQGLPVPALSGAGLEESSAAQLFLQSAQRARVGFMPSAQDRSAIARICRLVDGMPLAIELAAGWVRMLSCTEIADEIERDLHFLASTARDIPARHRSITAVFDQSWSLLEPRERSVLSRLAVFRGGFDRDAAEKVAGATPAVLSSLVSQSLVRRAGPHRYDLHELVRQYCGERLHETTAAVEVHLAHALAVRDLVVEARPLLIGPGQMEWLDRLETEINNVRAALAWTLEAGEITLGLEIAAAQGNFWYQRDYQAEGYRWLVQFLDAPDPGVPPLQRVDAQNGAGYLAFELGEFDAAQALLEKSLAMLEEMPTSPLLGTALVVLGQVQGSQGHYEKARATLERALSLAHDDRYAQRRRGSALMALADVTSMFGDDVRAQYLYAACAAIYREVGDQNAVAYALRKWGWSALACDELDHAEELACESLTLNLHTGSKIGVIACLACLGALRVQQERYEDAARLFGAVAGIMDRLSIRMRPMDYVGYSRALSELHSLMEPEACRRVMMEGFTWTLEKAARTALADSQNYAPAE